MRIENETELRTLVEEFRDEIAPRLASPKTSFFRHNFLEKGAALLAAIVLWYLFVYEQRTVYENYSVPIFVASPGGQLTATPDTPRARITLRGPRRAFYFLKDERIRAEVRVSGGDTPGVYPVALSPLDFTIPEKLLLTHFAPRIVTVTIRGD